MKCSCLPPSPPPGCSYNKATNSHQLAALADEDTIGKYFHGDPFAPASDIWLIVEAAAGPVRTGDALVHEYVHASNDDEHCNILAARRAKFGHEDKDRTLRLFQGEFRAYFAARDYEKALPKQTIAEVEAIRAKIAPLQRSGDASIKGRAGTAYFITHHIFGHYKVKEPKAQDEIARFVVSFVEQGPTAFERISSKP